MTRSNILSRWTTFKATEPDSAGFYVVETGRARVRLKDEDNLSQKEIDTLDKVNALNLKEESLNKMYSNIIFKYYEKGLFAWIKVSGGFSRETLGEFKKEDHKSFKELNEHVKDVSQNPDLFFMCTNCNQVLLFKKQQKIFKNQNIDLRRLLGDDENFFKFQSPGADFFCELCTKNDSKIQEEYQYSITKGRGYHD